MIPGYTFQKLKAWVDKLPNQLMGNSGPICQTGDACEEFIASALARPGDVAVIESAVASSMLDLLDEYFEGRHGRIYWNKPLEWYVREYPVVLEYRDDGPDVDDLTERRCVMDRDWRRVACYARVYRAEWAFSNV